MAALTATDKSPAPPTPEALRFGRYCALPRSRQLLVDGQLCAMGSRAFDLLMALLDARGAVLSKNDLMRRVWHDLHVDESNLRAQMLALRKALGGDRDIVKTIPGRGYMLATPVASGALDPGGAPAEPRETTPPAAAPAGATPPVPAAPTNLRRPAHRLIGRAVELAELARIIARSRLVTLLGSGGIGKTRLAIELGWAAKDGFADGAWLIDLAPVSDPASVASATAAALGVPVPGAAVPVEAIASFLEKQQRLLIFDNCEHLAEPAGSLIATLLDRAAGLSILVTSQNTLRLPGEQVYRLNPLAVPPEDAAEIAGFGAVALFVERAVAADRWFALGAANGAAVAEICQRLDGVPLAIEMAAARLPLLGLKGLQAGLDERLGMLRANPAASAARHATLRAMTEWSHKLLTAEEQIVFRRLSVFAGGFSLEAAIAVALSDQADQWEMVDALGRLIDKSLVAVEGGEPPRYRMLETLRLFAAEQLAASGERAAIAERHARYFADLFDRIHDQSETMARADWLGAFRGEIDNVRAALDWALPAPQAAGIAVDLAGSAGGFWNHLSLVAEGRRYCDRALALIDPDAPSKAAARLLVQSSQLWRASDYAKALDLAERSAACWRAIGDTLNLAVTMGQMGHFYTYLGRSAEAEAALVAALEILSGSTHKRKLRSVLENLAVFFAIDGKPAEAKTYFLRTLDVSRELKDPTHELSTLSNLAALEFESGAIDQAIDMQRECVRLLPEVNFRHSGLLVRNLATYLIVRGDIAEARVYATEAWPRLLDEGGHTVRSSLQQWALIGALEGQYRVPAQLLAYLDRAFGAAGDVLRPVEVQSRDRIEALVTAALPAEELERYRATGAGWTEAEAVRAAEDAIIAPGR